MKHIKLFEQFIAAPDAAISSITSEEKDLFKKMVHKFTEEQEPHLNVEDETSLLAICGKMGLKPNEVHHDFLNANFRDNESVISHRTELFLNKVICNYDLKPEEIEIMKSLCTKLGEDFDSMYNNCKTI